MFGPRVYATTLTGTLTVFVSPPDEGPTSITLNYHRDDPYAVTVTIAPPGHAAVNWWFGRDLLRAGLHAPAGLHEIVVSPDDGGRLYIDITSDAGRARVQLDAVEVARFLDRTDRIVHPGDEARHVDVDKAVRQTLKAAGR
jgi:hypothetical protein